MGFGTEIHGPRTKGPDRHSVPRQSGPISQYLGSSVAGDERSACEEIGRSCNDMKSVANNPSPKRQQGTARNDLFRIFLCLWRRTKNHVVTGASLADASRLGWRWPRFSTRQYDTHFSNGPQVLGSRSGHQESFLKRSVRNAFFRYCRARRRCPLMGSFTFFLPSVAQ